MPASAYIMFCMTTKAALALLASITVSGASLCRGPPCEARNMSGNLRETSKNSCLPPYLNVLRVHGRVQIAVLADQNVRGSRLDDVLRSQLASIVFMMLSGIVTSALIRLLSRKKLASPYNHSAFTKWSFAIVTIGHSGIGTFDRLIRC